MSAGLKTIVVATDFSADAERALQWSLALAKAHETNVVLVHAVEPTLAAVDFLQAPLHEDIRKELDRMKAAAISSGINASAEHQIGRAWQVIVSAAKAHNADLIVTGTRGRGRRMRGLLGSTADRIVRTSTVPVLVIHSNDAVPAGGVRRILVPVDFSEESALATSMAMRVLKGGGHPAKITLLHAVELLLEWPTPDMPTIAPRYWDDAERAAARQLESIAASMRTDQLQVIAKTYRGYPPDVIDSECRTSGFDMIAMGTRGKGGVERFMLGSVAERVVHHASCPVMTVRKPEADAPVRVSE